MTWGWDDRGRSQEALTRRRRGTTGSTADAGQSAKKAPGGRLEAGAWIEAQFVMSWVVLWPRIVI